MRRTVQRMSFKLFFLMSAISNHVGCKGMPLGMAGSHLGHIEYCDILPSTFSSTCSKIQLSDWLRV